MTVRTKIVVVCLISGIVPLILVYFMAHNAGLDNNRAFDQAITLSILVTLLGSFTSASAIRYWFFLKHFKKIEDFCTAVKTGKYDVHLDVPNENQDNADENELIQLMRNMNWMAHHVKAHELQLRQLVSNLKKSQAEIEAQKLSLETAYFKQNLIQKELEERTVELQETAEKVCNLLDNTGQGFLSFGDDLKISGEYSAECRNLFKRDLTSANVAEVLYPKDAEQQQFMQALLLKILQESDPYRREIYLTLLPAEIYLHQSYISIHYKIIGNPVHLDRKEIMLILTDITQQKELEQQIRIEKEHLSMVVKAVTQTADFIKVIGEYKKFCNDGIKNILNSSLPSREKLKIIFRETHTWKGVFSQLGMQGVARCLHSFEGDLERIPTRELHNDTTLLACLKIYPKERLLQCLTEEVQVLENTLGNDFLSRDERVFIERSRLKELEEKVHKTLSPCQGRQLIKDLRYLRYKPFKELLALYPNYVVNLAARYQKEINSFDISGGEMLVDPEKYSEFSRSLIHVFRNAIAHGVEPVEERMNAAKEMVGNIACSVEALENFIVVRITDDGQGIDPARIRQLAGDKGICPEETLAALTDEEIIDLIFSDGLSSTVEVNELAGRGVGLSAVKMELEKIGGWIQLTSILGIGTEFRFIIPIQEEAEVAPVSGMQFGEKVVKNTVQYLQENFDIQAQGAEYVGRADDILPLHSVSAFINLSGHLTGKLALSADAAVVQEIAVNMFGFTDDTAIEPVGLESSFAELFNIVAGNSLQMFPAEFDVEIDIPLTVQAEGASANFPNAEVHVWNITTAIGQLIVSLILLERNEINGKCACC